MGAILACSSEQAKMDVGLLDIGAPDLGIETRDGGALEPRCERPKLPNTDYQHILGVAGAPLWLFGPVENPTFSTAFSRLQTHGVNAFFPWFGLTEVGGSADISEHFDYFEPRSGPRNCMKNNPFEAARGKLKIIFPAFMFAGAGDDKPIVESIFRENYRRQKELCWGGTDDIVVAYQNFDEVANRRIASQFSPLPEPLLDNTRILKELMGDLSDKPVIQVEGPLPTLIADEPLPDKQRRQILDDFWTSVRKLTPYADSFGFDVYPVPSLSLRLPANYLLQSQQRAGSRGNLAVLQGFSYDAETGGIDPRRGPTYEESRFMAFDVLAHGAKNLIWYGASALKEDNAEHRQTWQAVTRAIHDVSAFAAVLTQQGPTIQQANPSVLVKSYDIENGRLLLVLNRSETSQTATLSHLTRSSVVDAEKGTLLEATASSITLELTPWQVQLLLVPNC